MPRSLKVVLGTLFAALLSIVLWGLMGLSGPASHLGVAAEHFRNRQYPEAIRVLDRAAGSVRLQKDENMLRELLDMRSRAHREVRNYTAALEDVERLIGLSGDDPQQHLGRIELLILDQRPGDALQVAMDFLAGNDVPRAAELAGVACQRMYEADLEELALILDRDLAPDVSSRAWSALEDYLFRPARDPEVQAGLNRFHEIVDQRLLGTGRADTADHRLSEVRQRIQQAIGFFVQSLNMGGRPKPALDGFVAALHRGGRWDDLLAQCEIHLRRFGHIDTATTAGSLANTHLEAGRLRAVIEVADRYLPPGSWRERLERGEFNGQERLVLLPEAKAYYALRDTTGLQRTASETQQIQASGLDLRPELHEILALHYELRGLMVESGQHLQALSNRILRNPGLGTERLVPAMRMRIGVAREQGLPPAEIEKIFQEWVTVWPEEPEPYLEFARYVMDTGNGERAYTHASRAHRLAGHNEDTLRVKARAADIYFAASGGDSSSLLADCLRLGTTTPPNLRDEILLLPLAELALNRGNARIALGSAERAAQQFLWSRWPRLLAARAATALGDLELAGEHLEALLEHHPGDREALVALQEARLANARPIDDLLVDLLRSCEPTVGTLMPLLRQALARGDAGAMAAIARRAAPLAHGHEEMLELLVDAWALTGDEDNMRETLAQLLAVVEPGSARGVRALAREFVIRANEVGPDILKEDVQQLANQLAEHSDVILDITEQLVELGWDRAAYPLLRVLILDGRHSEVRDGELFVTAGRVALRLGLDQWAAEHFLAAASFDEGGDAILPLALTLLKLGREAEARPWIAEMQVTDSVTAALAVRAGAPAAAAPWLADTLIRLPLNPEANCLVALETEPPIGWDGLRNLVATSRVPLLDLLSFLGAAGFEEHAVRLSEALREANPKNFPADLLHLRALGAAGLLEEAVRALEALREDHGDKLELLDAAASLMLRDAALSAPLGEALLQAVASSLPEASPAMVAAAIRTLSSSAIAAGGMESALNQLSELWRRFPIASGAGVDEAQTLLQYKRPLAALQLLMVLEPNVTADRREFWESWFAAAEALVFDQQGTAANPEIAEVTRDQARRVVDLEKPYGSATRFLLLDLLPRIRVSEDPELMEEARRLVNNHIALFIAGGDPNVSLLIHSLEWLERLDGSAAVLEQTEALLRHDASLVPVWELRAEFLERDGRADQAVAELRNVVAHLLDPSLVWTLARIAGQAGQSLPGDEELVIEAFGAGADTPEVRLVQGLLALRAARYVEAESHLAQAVARPDGAHLYYRALANLSLPGKPAADLAAGLFEQLLDGYPDSPLTLYVDSFVRQLRL